MNAFSGPLRSKLCEISTKTSLLKRAQAGSVEARLAIVYRYQTAICRLLVHLLGEVEGELATESVLCALEGGKYLGWDPAKGSRFRNYLTTCVRRAANDHRHRLARLPIIAVDPDTLAKQTAAKQASSADDLEALAIEEMRAKVVADALLDLEVYQKTTPNNLSHTVLCLRVEYPDDDSEQLAERLSNKTGKLCSAAKLRKLLSRACKRFAAYLCEAVRETIVEPTPEDVEEELCALGLWEKVRKYLSDEA